METGIYKAVSVMTDIDDSLILEAAELKKQNKSINKRTVLKYAAAAAAALLLITPETFGTHENLPQLIISIAIFAAVFTLSMKFKKSPITLMLLSGAVGLILYGICGL